MARQGILLVNPAYTLDPAGGFTRTDVESTRQKGLFTKLPLLGLGYLASPLLKRGFDVGIRDASPCGITERRIVQDVVERKPFAVGVAVFSPQLRSAYSLLSKLDALRRETGQRFHLVVGGPHVSTDPAFAAKMPADYGLAGDAEHSFASLMSALRGDGGDPGDLDSIPGLVRRDADGRAVVTPLTKAPRLDELEWPAHHLLDLDRYKSGWGPGRVTAVLTARGCPFHCIFCGTQATQAFQSRSVDDVVSELAMVTRDLGVSFVEFNDELFTYDKERIRALCERILERGVKVRWGCQTRADYIDRATVQAMAKAGCVRISYGIESGSAEIRRRLGKNIGDEVAEAAFRWCREARIDGCALMMIGHPGETRADVEKSIAFAKKHATITVFQVHRITPDTPLYGRLRRDGKIPPLLWEDFMHGRVEFPYFVPDDLDLEYMVRSLKRAYREFYFRPRYLGYRLRRVKSFRDVRNLARIAMVILRDIVLGGRVRGGQIAQGDRPADRAARAAGPAVDPVRA